MSQKETFNIVWELLEGSKSLEGFDNLSKQL